jgi:hypothetical protein
VLADYGSTLAVQAGHGAAAGLRDASPLYIDMRVEAHPTYCDADEFATSVHWPVMVR